MNVRDGIGNYSVWGVAVTEVEIDILTGEMRVARLGGFCGQIFNKNETY